MYDMSVPNAAPGKCAKCNGSGKYRWGAVVNGKSSHEGTCFSCKGTGQQSKADIRRNKSYNYFKLRNIRL